MHDTSFHPPPELSVVHPPNKSSHICGWTRRFTHLLLWMDTSFHPPPTRRFTHRHRKQAINVKGESPNFSMHNARARFLTIKIFNIPKPPPPVENSTDSGNSIAQAAYGRGTPAGFPRTSRLPLPLNDWPTARLINQKRGRRPRQCQHHLPNLDQAPNQLDSQRKGGLPG